MSFFLLALVGGGENEFHVCTARILALAYIYTSDLKNIKHRALKEINIDLG